MWVVKLGGSLQSSPQLKQYLLALTDTIQQRIVLVPGGGTFADQVRITQKQYRLDDVTAHNMALLAMEQYGHMLCDICPKLQPVHTIDELAAYNNEQYVPVWMPYQSRSDYQLLPTSWKVSSDSLALWLADRMSATALLLVKSCAAPDSSIQQLAEAEYLDRYFPVLARELHIPIGWFNTQAGISLASVLQDVRLLKKIQLLIS